MQPANSSEAQTQANRANALHSTGPRTDAGKAKSSQNARVHGLCSRQLHLADEEAPVFASLRDSLVAELAPAGELETLHFEAILHAHWNLRRCRMNEANLFAAHADPFGNPETRAALKTLATYTARHERALHRATQELRRLQNERATRTSLAEENPSPLVDTARVRRGMLAELRAKAQINKVALNAALAQVDKGSPVAPVSYYQFDLAA